MRPVQGHRRFILLFTILSLAVILAFISSNKETTETAVPTAAPLVAATPAPRIFVTHTIANPGQLPLRATIQIRPDVSGFDEMSIFIDAGSGYETFTCKSLPCEVARNYTQPGIVKYYAVGKSAVTVTDPAGAPEAYKSFKVG